MKRLGFPGKVGCGTSPEPRTGIVTLLDGREQIAGRPRIFGRFAAREEYARTVEDVLARRMRLLFLDARLAASLAAEVGELLRQETGADPQAEAFRELAASYLGMPV